MDLDALERDMKAAITALLTAGAKLTGKDAETFRTLASYVQDDEGGIDLGAVDALAEALPVLEGECLDLTSAELSLREAERDVAAGA